jgi:hypothetical protein
VVESRKSLDFRSKLLPFPIIRRGVAQYFDDHLFGNKLLIRSEVDDTEAAPSELMPKDIAFL